MFKQKLVPVAALIAAFALMAGTVGSAAAQGSDATTPHPAHIHSGTCEELGDVVFPLTDVEVPALAGTPVVDSETSGTPEASPESMAADDAGESFTILEVSVDDILAEEHAINVHESAENIGNYIACGNLTGEMTDGQLTVDLEELNDSGLSGQATLLDNGDDTTTVLITLGPTDTMATPEA